MSQPDQQKSDVDVAAQINAAIASAIAGGAGTQIPPLLGGVPEGYAATVDGPVPYRPGVEVQVPARYREGDEWNPGGWSQERRARMQRALSESGLLRGPYRSGFWGPESATAYKTLIALANTQGLDDVGMARLLARDDDLRSTLMPDAAFKPDPYLRPDSATLASHVRSTMEQLLGREPTAGEMVHLGRQLEAEHRAAYDAGTDADRERFLAEQEMRAANGGVDVDPVARFEQYFRDRYKPEMQRRDAMDDMTKLREVFFGNVHATDALIA